MEIFKKTQIAIIGLLATCLLPGLTSCDKQDVGPASANSGVNSSREHAEIAAREAAPTTVALKPEELGQIRSIFSKIDPSLFVLEIEEDDKAPVRIGSAAIRDLERSGAYYSSDFTTGRIKGSNLVTKIITKIIIKKFLDDQNNVGQLAEVESILNTAAAR
jgi:hypothetical protein